MIPEDPLERERRVSIDVLGAQSGVTFWARNNGRKFEESFDVSEARPSYVVADEIDAEAATFGMMTFVGA